MKESRKSKHKGIEKREFFAPVEFRDDGTNELALIACPIRADKGYGVTDSYGRFTETVSRAAVADLVARANAGTLDTYVYVGHNSSTVPLAATRSKTLRFSQDPTTGDLIANLTLDARQSISTDAAISVSRGDLRGVSIGFITDPKGDHWNAQETERTITRFADLPEFSLVARPASTETYVGLKGPGQSGGRSGRMTTIALRSDLEAMKAARPRVTTMQLRAELARMKATNARHAAKPVTRSTPTPAATPVKPTDAERRNRAVQLAYANQLLRDGFIGH